MNEILANNHKTLSAINGRRENMLARLRLWSEINSGSDNAEGLAQMRELLISAFARLPGDIREIALPEAEIIAENGQPRKIEYQPAVLLSVRPEAEIQIVLTGHYDTVFPKTCDFQTTKMPGDDKLAGPGVADMKGGIIVMLEALAAFEQSDNKDRLGYKVLLSPDEEIGSFGSAGLLAELGAKADIGMTYEPAMIDGSLAGARKGSGNFTLVIKGKAAHAGREHDLGRNAIAEMARFAAGLDALNGQKPGVTFNFSKIDGGGAVNIVPDLAIGRYNVRMHDEEDTDWINRQVSKLIANINAKPGFSADLHGSFSRPPKPMSRANETVFNWVRQAGNALGVDIVWNKSGGVCEGNNLWAAGCANVDTLGVVGANIHSDREYMLISSLEERAKLSALILMNIAAGRFDAKAVKKMAMQEIKQ